MPNKLVKILEQEIEIYEDLLSLLIESAYLFLREISAPTATYQSSGKMG